MNKSLEEYVDAYIEWQISVWKAREEMFKMMEKPHLIEDKYEPTSRDIIFRKKA